MFSKLINIYFSYDSGMVNFQNVSHCYLMSFTARLNLYIGQFQTVVLSPCELTPSCHLNATFDQAPSKSDIWLHRYDQLFEVQNNIKH